jgi:hypothetical protein
LNKSGSLRCPTFGLLCIEINDYGDWDQSFVEGGFIGACYGVMSFHLMLGSVKCFCPQPVFEPEPPDYKTGQLIAAV